MNNPTYFTNWQCPLWTSTNMQTKMLSIPLGAFIEILIDEGSLFYVSYTDKKNNLYLGYVEKRFVEEYQRVLAFGHVDVADIETPDPNDFAQYVVWEMVKQPNMCGQMCVAKITGLKLSGILSGWKAKSLPFYKQVFKAGKARGTNSDELISLFSAFGREAVKIRQTKYTPTLFAELAKNYDLVCSVKMNPNNGELRNGSVLHWVILLEVTLERKMMGWVRVWNPAMNSEEMYSWDEWLKAAGIPDGVMVFKPEEL